MKKMRIAPLTPDELSDEQQQILKAVSDKKGNYPNVFGTLIRNVPLIKAYSPFGIYTLRGSSLDPLERELIILRTSVNVGSDYEWHHHHHIGLRVGLDEATMQKIKDKTSLGNPDYDLLMQFTDELTSNFKMSDASWTAMNAKYGFEQTLDAIFTVGSYMALSMALNSCGVQIETH